MLTNSDISLHCSSQSSRAFVPIERSQQIKSCLVAFSDFLKEGGRGECIIPTFSVFQYCDKKPFVNTFLYFSYKMIFPKNMLDLIGCRGGSGGGVQRDFRFQNLPLAQYATFAQHFGSFVRCRIRNSWGSLSEDSHAPRHCGFI